jgi:hypothetical protein
MRRYRDHSIKRKSSRRGKSKNKATRKNKRGGVRRKVDCTKFMNPEKSMDIRDNDIIMRDMCSLIMEKAKLWERTDIDKNTKTMESYPIHRELEQLKRELEEWNSIHNSNFAEGKLPNEADCSFLCHVGGKRH